MNNYFRSRFIFYVTFISIGWYSQFNNIIKLQTMKLQITIVFFFFEILNNEIIFCEAWTSTEINQNTL